MDLFTMANEDKAKTIREWPIRDSVNEVIIVVEIFLFQNSNFNVK